MWALLKQLGDLVARRSFSLMGHTCISWEVAWWTCPLNTLPLTFFCFNFYCYSITFLLFLLLKCKPEVNTTFSLPFSHSIIFFSSTIFLYSWNYLISFQFYNCLFGQIYTTKGYWGVKQRRIMLHFFQIHVHVNQGDISWTLIVWCHIPN